MSCCVLNPKQLCKISACAETLVTGFAAPEAGTYTLVLMFMDAQYRYEQEFLEDEPLDFDLTENPLNESQGYIAQILEEDGDVVHLIEGENDYDGIQFETVIVL